MNHPRHLSIDQFVYDLPEERIAKYPLPERDASKLLIYREGLIEDSRFRDLSTHLPGNSLLILNNTRVVRARMIFPRGEGRRPIEVFCLEPSHGLDVQIAMGKKNELDFQCLVGGAKKWKEGLLTMPLRSGDVELTVEKISRNEDDFTLRFRWNGDLTFAEILEIAGKTPIPPYLKRESEEGDISRYQTVYARFDGSVAAPTAGLHFTGSVMKDLEKKEIAFEYVTLHVGAGTFKPVGSETLEGHEMHHEEIHVDTGLIRKLLEHKGPVISVGTTSTRTLESLYWLGVKILQVGRMEEIGQWEPYGKSDLPERDQSLRALLLYLEENNLSSLTTRTQLMIAPGYTFRVISGLITNFHQPKSTLMLLVAAATGNDWSRIYDHALKNDFRFLSYGDSTLLFIPEKYRTP